MIRLLIADDHPVVREGLARIIETIPGLHVAGQAVDGDGVVRAVQAARFDAVLMDLNMPGPGFLEVLRRVHEIAPRLPVLILSVHPEEQFALRALHAGAAGYLSKNQSPEQLRDALHKVIRGGRWLSPAVTERLADTFGKAPGGAAHETLSDREFEVLRHLGHGRSAKETAAVLGISPKTVSTYRDRIRQKLALRSNAEIVRYAMEHELA